MDEATKQALTTDKIIDITTTGRKSGTPKRIEIWFHNLDGTLYITGRPGRRSWYANVLANPALTFHLKESAQADIPARATAITDPAEKRRILLAAPSLHGYVTDANVGDWVAGSPLIEVELQA